MTTTTPNPAIDQIGWLSRPDGGRMFTPGKVHDYDASIDLDAVATLRTVCGTEVPEPVLRQMRGVRRHGTQTYTAALMDQAEMANAEPCRRCVAKTTGGTR